MDGLAQWSAAWPTVIADRACDVYCVSAHHLSVRITDRHLECSQLLTLVSVI